MELLQLKYFKTVAETGKISDAAQALFISAPALSTSISRLEKELGVPLFERTNNRIILNPQGQIFLRYVNQIFSDLEVAKTELRQSIMHRGQHVSLATAGYTQWTGIITAFSQSYPWFSLQCTGITRKGLAGSGLSAEHSFLLAAEEDIPESYADKLDSIFLFEDCPVLMVRPDHPLAERESVELSELSRETMFLPMREYALYEHLMRAFETNSVPFPAGNAYSHLVAQQLVTMGLGVAFSTRFTVCSYGTNLRYIPVCHGGQSWICRLYWRKNRTLTEDEKVFLRYAEQFYRMETP